ncbi:DegT/DnrJ/EryC1/StrS family aminotransferase [Candidatus Pacearchaeota archaeon]|nr:DegT/DnrJ/EryC1/StrS family aminotransferase [Candidatus Pacearchaeota archaeon]MBI2057077.1 DegT/DnrJ/EryC1/StrS family aminotransferase [Candidatus Pacearchaeota archaeon]
MNKILVKYINFPLQYKKIKKELLGTIENVFESGNFVLGPEVEKFEKNFAKSCQTKYALGVGDGTSALFLVMKALGIGTGDEVITVPNSFIATAGAIAATGAKPVFVDADDDYNINPRLIEEAITKKTKAILPVHLTGRPANLDKILEISDKNKIYLIEDAAQAVGAKYNGKKVGSFGIAGCFSLHPLKNLNAYGDSGIITTQDKQLYENLKKMRNHGLKNRDECDFFAFNSRLDELQAAMLNVKMKYLDKWTKRKREIASFYQKKLSDIIKVPLDKPNEEAVYHTFIIQANKRDDLQKFLLQKGIETKIHYPIPIHLQKAAQYLGYKKGDFPKTEEQTKKILSLPIYPELKKEQLELVVNEIRKFYS